MLRDFLSYAARGGSRPAPEGAARVVASSDPLDPLVTVLASRLRAEGLVVHAGYGTSAHRLDLAVEDPHRPGRVLAAVETDGPRYAAMSSTRDRDRLRIEQLRRLGWEHVRIWSTDLFRDPARDVARVNAAVRAASVSQTGSKPEQTRDDTAAGWGERPNESSHDQWLREQRPPHWG
jgi:REase_MTES_1575